MIRFSVCDISLEELLTPLSSATAAISTVHDLLLCYYWANIHQVVGNTTLN